MSLTATRARLPVVYGDQRIATTWHPRTAAELVVKHLNKTNPSDDNYYQFLKVTVTAGAYLVTRRPLGERNPDVLAD